MKNNNFTAIKKIHLFGHKIRDYKVYGVNKLFIRLFIRTTLYDKALETVKNVVSNIPKELIKDMNLKIEPYWKFDDNMVAEIKLEITKEFDNKVKNEFLNSISDNWIFFHLDKSEALSSKTMEGSSAMNFDLEMIEVHFRD